MVRNWLLVSVTLSVGQTNTDCVEYLSVTDLSVHTIRQRIGDIREEQAELTAGLEHQATHGCYRDGGIPVVAKFGSGVDTGYPNAIWSYPGHSNKRTWCIVLP